MSGNSHPRDGAPEDGTDSVRQDWRRFESPSAGVVSTVAAATGRDVTALPPLHQYVDADAVDSLLNSGQDGVRVSFEYDGTTVVVAADGTVEVTL